MENRTVSDIQGKTSGASRGGSLGGRAAIWAMILGAGLPMTGVAHAQDNAQPAKPQPSNTGPTGVPLTEEQKLERDQKLELQRQIDAKQAAVKEAEAKKAAAGASSMSTSRPRGASDAPGQPGSSPIRSPGQAGNPGANPGGNATGNPARQPGLKIENGNGYGDGAGGLAPQTGSDEATLSDFSDAIDLKTLVDFVATTLKVNISSTEALAGSVVLNAPVTVKKDKLIPLLGSLLEQQGFTIIKNDDTGWYSVIPATDSPFHPGDTTRVIPTPGLRPSSLSGAINEQINSQGRPTRLSFMDDLGVIIITDTPHRIDMLNQLVERILARSHEQQFMRFELSHVAASVMRQRVIDLLGTGTGTTGPVIPNQGNQQAIQQQLGASTGPIPFLAERLTVDASGNAMIFRGFEEEADRVARVIAVLDKPNELDYKQYYAGSAALQIAQLAERLGLGHVETVDTTPATQATTQPAFGQQNQGSRNVQPALQNLTNQQTSTLGGPVMVVDTARNTIIYYGTASQQRQLKSLIDKFDTNDEVITIRAYKILNQQAIDVSDVLQGMINGQSGSDSSSQFFGGGNGFGNNRQTGNAAQNRNNRTTNGSTTGRTTNNRNNNNQNNNNFPRFGFGPFGNFNNQGRPQGQTAGGDNIDPLGGNVFVIADTANNQVLVKASVRQQEEFAKLINKLDQRRPQVYIEVQIVSVTANDDFRFAVETQGIAGQFGLNTNFGLGQLPGTNGFGTPDQFQSQKNIATGLTGLTAALIKTDQVPLILTALKNNSDTRILSSPQILVDDNQTAEVLSTDEQPTTTTTQTTGNPAQTSFGQYVSAGTTLTVTPSISEGGYMRLNYNIELSNFIGSGSNGVPPPKQTRNVNSDSVTIPGDTTIIVGGIKVDSKSNTIVKVPLLGDIPFLGYLFRDTNKTNASTRLYVFITPRILRDAHFADLRLLTRGPRGEAGVASDIPTLEPVMIEMFEPYKPKSPLPAGTTAPVPLPPPAVKAEVSRGPDTPASTEGQAR